MEIQAHSWASSQLPLGQYEENQAEADLQGPFRVVSQVWRHL